MMLTQARLKEVMDYDPDTGLFRWRVSHNATGGLASVGQPAGYHDPKGYLLITIARRHYRAHRLAFLWMTGAWPEQEVDHINVVRDDNRWANLRNSNRHENLHNLGGPRIDNKSGRLGVCYDKNRKAWVAQITAQGKHRNLGRFPTPEAAHAAYLKAKDELHPTHQRLRNQGE